MDEATIEATLAALAPHEYGWRAEIPPDRGTFLGRPTSLDIETTEEPRKSNPPRPTEAELALARTILAALPAILAEAARQFTDDVTAEGDPGALDQVADPHAWISRLEMEEEGPAHWAFVVGRRDNDDFGYHLEFEGAEFRSIWSGD